MNPAEPSDLYNLSKVVGGPDAGEQNFIPCFVRDAEKGKIILRTDPASEKDYIHIDDVALLLKQIACGGRQKIYNIAGGRQITHGEWLKRLTAMTGCAVEVEKDAPMVKFVPVDISRVRKEFGFRSQSVFTVLETRKRR